MGLSPTQLHNLLIHPGSYQGCGCVQFVILIKMVKSWQAVVIIVIMTLTAAE